MGTPSLNELLPLINQQIELQEALNHQLLKAKALSDITISIVESSIKLSEESLNSMIRIVTDSTNFP
jgi:hypothetical protein